MPIGVMITTPEAEAARAAEIGKLTGNFFEYDPRETFGLIEKVEATSHEGAPRLVTRMADIYGRHLAKGVKAAVVSEPAKRQKGGRVKRYADRDESVERGLQSDGTEVAAAALSDQTE